MADLEEKLGALRTLPGASHHGTKCGATFLVVNFSHRGQASPRVQRDSMRHRAHRGGSVFQQHLLTRTSTTTGKHQGARLHRPPSTNGRA